MAAQRLRGSLDQIQGSPLIRGDTHKAADEENAVSTRHRKKEVKVSQQQNARLKREAALEDAKVLVCEHCARPFIKNHSFAMHVKQCKSALEHTSALKVRVPLRPASEMAKDSVHSGASLGIGKGVSARGIDNMHINLPHAWHFVLLTVPPPVSEGWARKNVGRKHTKFTPVQVDFLRSMFDAHLHGGHKVKESEAHESMKTKFNDASTDSPYAKKLVLTKSQIKSWFSTEKGRRTAAGKRLVAKNVIERAATELAAAEMEETAGGGQRGEEGGVAGGGRGVDGGVDEGNNSIHSNGMEGKETHHQLEPGRDKVEDKGGSGGMEEGVWSRLSGLPDAEVLMQRSLYVVVTEQWEEINGFEVWELEEDVGCVCTLSDEFMLRLVRGRKWVHLICGCVY